MNSVLEHASEPEYDDPKQAVATVEPFVSSSQSVILPALGESTDLSYSNSTTGLTNSSTTATTIVEVGTGNASVLNNIDNVESKIFKSPDSESTRKSAVTFADFVETTTDIAVVTIDDIPISDNNNTKDETDPFFTSPSKSGDVDDSKSLISSSGKSKFGSKELRGNLTRRQMNRNPYTYYEVINILGLGSMGSVSMVRKRASAIGGSARKKVSDDGEDVENVLERREPDQLVCFQLPIIGPLVIWLHQSFRKPISSDDIITTTKSNSDRSGATLQTVSSQDNDNNSQTSTSSDLKFAMKSIHLSRCTDPSFVEELQNEIAILKTLDHPHIEKVIETFEYEQQIFVILELCYGGDLYQRDPYTEDEAARITSSILSAISFMHSRNILHRDLKYENILFVDDSPTAEIKLIDFGLSKQFFSNEKECSDGVGTIYTMAPEVLKGKYTKQADMWSIGVIAYMLMSSQMPFYGRKRSDIVDQIMEGKYEYKGRRWKKISKAGKAFIDDLLVVDPDDRATDDEAMKSSWLNRRYSTTVRNPKDEEMALAKQSVLRYATYSKVRQMALMVIAHKSTSAEIGILRKIFQQLDTGTKGYLTYEQFRNAIKDPSLSEDDCRRIFDSVDLDGSDKIRYTEFLAATIESHGTISEVKLAEAFDRLDSDDSGYISVENLLEILGDTFTKEDVEGMIKEVTVSNGQISYKEFLSLWDNKEDVSDDFDENSIKSAEPFDVSHDIIKTVEIAAKNPFDSERSTGVMSNLSSDQDDTQTDHYSDTMSRANFLQGKRLSERNMLLFVSQT